MSRKQIKIPTDTNLKRIDWGFVVKIILWTLFLSVTLSLVSTELMSVFHAYVAALILLFLIFIGILFDIIGIAATSANEAPFHSMSTRRVRGAREALYLIRNADKVSNFCNDVVGDISGIVSGSVSAVIIAKFFGESGDLSGYAAAALAGIVTALTVFGKALGKSVAIRKSNMIIYYAATAMCFFAGFVRRNKG